MTPRRAVLALIAASGLLRLAWAASLGPGNDEAYYALFVSHPDWSYYDQPPMLALVEAAGLALTGGIDRPTVFGLRLGFVALFAGSTWWMYRLAARRHGERAGFLAALALNVAAYPTAAAGVFALPDGPLMFFWLLTLERLAAALDSGPGGGIRPWLWVGLAWGGAMLSKYHAAFLPAATLLYLAVEPSARRWIWHPGPYLAAGVGLACFAPVIAWNASHGWASFAFQGGRALGGTGFRPEFLAASLGGMALWLFPWIFLGLTRWLAGVARGWSSAVPLDRFLFCQAVLPLAAFGAVACTREVLPHWSLVGFLAAYPGLGRAWANRWRADPARMRRRLATRAAIPTVLVAIVAADARLGFLPPSLDPASDSRGWDEVARALRGRGLVDRPGTFAFAGTWFQSGQLAFALRRAGSDTPVLCYNPSDARGFGGWSGPEDWVGSDGILVSSLPRSVEPGMYDRYFDRIEPLEPIPIARDGATVRTVRLYRCVSQRLAFPFGGREVAGPGAGAARIRR